MSSGDAPRELSQSGATPPLYRLSSDSVTRIKAWLQTAQASQVEAMSVALLALEQMDPRALSAYQRRNLQDLHHPGHNLLRLDSQTTIVWRFSTEPQVIDVFVHDSDDY